MLLWFSWTKWTKLKWYAIKEPNKFPRFEDIVSKLPLSDAFEWFHPLFQILEWIFQNPFGLVKHSKKPLEDQINDQKEVNTKEIKANPYICKGMTPLSYILHHIFNCLSHGAGEWKGN